MFIYCDQEHQLHQLVGKEEVGEMFGVDAVREFWGGTDRSREAIALLRKLKRLSLLKWSEVAELIGAGQTSVYRWLSGDSEPKDDMMDSLRRMAGEFERKEPLRASGGRARFPIQNGKTRGNGTVKAPATRPNEYKKMPAKR